MSTPGNMKLLSACIHWMRALFPLTRKMFKIIIKKNTEEQRRLCCP